MGAPARLKDVQIKRIVLPDGTEWEGCVKIYTTARERRCNRLRYVPVAKTGPVVELKREEAQ